jgi:hypothetical protein
MRKMFLVAIAVTTLAGVGGAFAQSQQGGYLGENPGGHQTAAAATVQDFKTAPPDAWCRAKSFWQDRCASRAQDDHTYCMQHDSDHYASCRGMMDGLGTNH